MLFTGTAEGPSLYAYFFLAQARVCAVIRNMFTLHLRCCSSMIHVEMFTAEAVIEINVLLVQMCQAVCCVEV